MLSTSSIRRPVAAIEPPPLKNLSTLSLQPGRFPIGEGLISAIGGPVAGIELQQTIPWDIPTNGAGVGPHTMVDVVSSRFDGATCVSAL
ncbi:hypothetical protein CRG98_012690 [Punica granatum]|uniref:Uncharacterized protein n=1 Tax=Punica granatum TaxID=22663 RepID=A0A2I0KEJ7_PUNGR|nr:hypothetical protein CRG98_012690 [Punica granatum]